MKHSKITALALTGAMLAGTFATATPVLAGGTETNDVSCTSNDASYTMVIPTSVTVANSGYNTLGDGITIKNLANADKVKSIEVTASSENAWKLKKDDNNTITYNLCESAESTGAITDNKLSFTEKTAMADTDGSTKTCGINVDDYSEAEAGDYSDTITWTATAVEYTGITFAEGNDTHEFTSLSATWTPTYTVETANTAEDKKNLKWSSSDENVATVNESTGEITPVANGTSDITVSTSDGKYSAICKVTVNIQAATLTGISFADDITVRYPESFNIVDNMMKTTPEDVDVTGADFDYTVKTGANVVSVSSDGTVIPLGCGNVEIYVSYKDNSSIYAILSFNVFKPTE